MVKHSAAEREGISPRLLVSPAEERRAVTEGLLEGRTALVVGVANKRSIAWAIARRLDAAGARCALTFQGERTQRDVERLAGELGRPAPTMTLEVTDDGQADAAVAKAAQELGGIDILVHAVAFALAEDLGGRYVDTSLEGFRTALEISSYSLTALARRVEPHMRERGGGAIVTLSYLAAQRAVPGYNVMGVAKSALESMVRYLAWDLGEAGIRVNAVSAGPVRTLAARGIPGFTEMAEAAAGRSPLRREITAEEVADAALFLVSPLASAITGHVLYVDAGFHAMGL
jgi:enoyl-[acyl-carrier protein] reductase I